MNKLKKLIAAILAMAMVLATGMTVFATTSDPTSGDADTSSAGNSTTSITIHNPDGTTDGSTYKAYLILTATVSPDDETKVAYKVNEKYADVLMEVSGKTTNKEVIDYIADLTGERASELRTFADAVYLKIRTWEPDAQTDTNVFENVQDGYYLIVETSISAHGTYSFVMLDTAHGETQVTTKESAPILQKKVKEKNDSTGNETGWQDAADYDIGDDVPFQLTGTLPSTYSYYNSYKYVFHDTLSEGFTFNNDVEVWVDGIKLDNTNNQYYEVVTEGLEDECSFEVRFADLKKVPSVKDNTQGILVYYTAKLNDSAKIIGKDGNTSTGNPNTAYLEYSNNPYYNGTGEETTSTTQKDKVIVFTYKVNVKKVDENQKLLDGAGFTLFKFDGTEYKAVDAEKKGEGMTTFVFEGLDAGQYKLEETTVPAGYNKAEDIEFVITAAYETESDDPQFTKFEINDIAGAKSTAFESNTNRLYTATVINQRGILLPSTGGIGTTIFYMAGALLMLGGSVLLMKNKRTVK